ncbi:Troponin T [Dirofilaria immitis]|nr:Troponin T [Dirofilaria immitis]
MAEEEEEITEEEEDEEVEEEEEAEEAVEPASAVPESAEDRTEKAEATPQLRRAPPQEKEEAPAEQTEAEKAMLVRRYFSRPKRHQEEEAAKIQDYEERRRVEKEKIEEELRALKEKQEQRRQQREQEEREFAERQRENEEKRRQEEEESKARIEAEKQRREEERKKRQNLMAGSFAAGTAAGGKNFVIQKSEKTDQMKTLTVNLRQARNERRREKIAKQAFLEAIQRRGANVADLLPNDLKDRIKQLHSRIVKLEGEKYDLEKDTSAKNMTFAKGLDPEEAAASIHPPKINVVSKFDRQIDRRSYGDRRDLYEHPIVKKQPKIAHGTARPPPEWGRRENEELEQIRKNLEPPKYVEQVKADGDAAKPPIQPIPLHVPGVDEVEDDEKATEQDLDATENETKNVEANDDENTGRKVSATARGKATVPPPTMKNTSPRNASSEIIRAVEHYLPETSQNMFGIK